HVMDLQRPWNELAGHFAAVVVLYALGQFLSAKRDATLVVIKLHVVDAKSTEFYQVTPVVRVKQSRIERRDNFIECRLRLNTLQRWNSLSACWTRKQGQQEQGQQYFGESKRHFHRR